MARSSPSAPKSGAPRGIAPELLVSQVRSTAPYVFGDGSPAIAATPPAAFVRSLDEDAVRDLSHEDYFRLCLCAHYLTCATLVPTDVDNQIRQKLWAPGLPLATVLAMGEFVLESAGWDFLPLTTRASFGAKGTPEEDVALSGHFGEWFTVAAAAYAALGKYAASEARALREKLLEAIGAVTDRHSAVFGSVWRAGDALGALRASATIAHDFGDLDRVIDAWDVPIADPLRLRFRGLGTAPFDAEKKLRHQGRLWTAGELYKAPILGSSMALENHRHFALRKPRGLRGHPALRVPLGPFFDDWGTAVATHLAGEPLVEVALALTEAAVRIPRTHGYPRALHALLAARPELEPHVRPALRHPELKPVLRLDRAEHEARWAKAALAHLEEIPSRAR